MSPRLLLCAFLLGTVAPLPAADLAPGSDLRSALELATDPADARYGLNGAPPGARGAVPAAPEEPGTHWLVRYASDGSVAAWRRFRITGEPGTTPTPLNIPIDRTPPVLRWSIDGAQVERDGITLIGPEARLQASAQDGSGIEGAVLATLGDATAAQPPAALSSLGSAPVSLSARDRLGNRASLGPLPLQHDADAPSLAARRATPIEGMPDDVVRAGNDPVTLSLADAGAGLRGFSAGAITHDFSGEAEASLRLDGVPADGRYRLDDRLGNTVEATLPLRIDSAPPRLRLRADGVELDLSHPVSLRRSQTVELDAVDERAGVARACVALSIWYDECRPLPLSAVGIAPGRYRLEFRAVDRLGQRAHQYLPLEVLP
jgi:hypothetical protein